VRFVRKHAAEYGVDPHRIGAMGFSAGAHLAMMLGTLDANDGMGICGEDPEDTGKVGAVVSYFGPTQLWADDLPEVPRGIVAKLVGPERDGYEDRCRAASPVTYLSKGDAPILMFQGTADRLVVSSQAVVMIEAMTKAGVGGRAEMIAGAGHGWGGAELERTLRESVEFFRSQLGADPRGEETAPKKSPDSTGVEPNGKPAGDDKGAGR
jgi:acetyl esterase/lipase